MTTEENMPQAGSEAGTPIDDLAHRRQIEREAIITTNLAKYGPPCECHDELKRLTGNWRTEQEQQLGPGGQPILLRGIGTGAMILGGRYFQFKQTFGDGDLQFEAVKTWGYDRITGLYTGNYIDSLSTGTLLTEGSWDAERKALWEWGHWSNPTLGRREPVSACMLFGDPDERYSYKLFIPGADGQMTEYLKVRFFRI